MDNKKYNKVKVNQRKGQKMSKTKFEITMSIEVEDVGDVPADASSLTDSITRVIEENITPIDIRKIHVSRTGKVNITPVVKQ